MGKNIRLAVFGCGFWSKYQIAGWREHPGVEIVALYNRTLAKAQEVGRQFGVEAVYDDPERLLSEVEVDAVDIITDVDTHAQFVAMAARHGRAVISQKPMAPTIVQAVEMVDVCRRAGVKLYVHENWRHQTPLRQLERILDSGEIGQVFRARMDFMNGFPVFNNQPFLRTLKQFILTDIGSHILDTARCLFGEAKSLYCKTQKIHTDIAGEDVATVLLDMGQACVTCNMAYAENHHEHECFPQTFVFVEGTKGTVCLGPDYWIRVTTSAGTLSRQFKPPRYSWADPAYDIAHASIVACNGDLLAGLRGEREAETTGQDNLKTMRLVYGAYASAKTGKPIDPATDDWFDASLPQGAA